MPEKEPVTTATLPINLTVKIYMQKNSLQSKYMRKKAYLSGPASAHQKSHLLRIHMIGVKIAGSVGQGTNLVQIGRNEYNRFAL
ncbi:hypothetical protein CHS0354_006831 [Potamilus streckersoni]|uniref:Uncharacterized protein n=1 Tax=Potamilus streckersoni TaxID=2493646 RepID=A0AAE0WCZ0_9BIVA|nr:hypothetical protein CHS0354_006831 [Potamilus streckersoni]